MSSQESDTHHQPPHRGGLRGNPSNLPASSLGVKPANQPTDRPDKTRLVSAVPALQSLPNKPAHSGHDPQRLVDTRAAPDLPKPTRSNRVLRTFLNPGTGLLRVAITRSAVVSVPPCRADEENINPAFPRNTNPLHPGALGACQGGGFRCLPTGPAPPTVPWRADSSPTSTLHARLRRVAPLPDCAGHA